MNFVFHIILGVLISVFSLSAFAKSQPWVKFICNLSTNSDFTKPNLVLVAGQIGDGIPLLSLEVDGKDLTDKLIQYRLLIDTKEYKFDSYLVWIDDEKELPGSAKSDAPKGTQALSVVEMQAKKVVTDGIDSIEYSLLRTATVLRRDREITKQQDTRKIKYNCLEPIPL